jgi:tripartite-type tricarboxylate transporter receptor subunit TctC
VTSSWQAYLVRSETPPEIVDKLGKAFKEGLKDKELVGTFEKMGFTVENYGPKEAAEFLKKDQQVKIELIKVAKMNPE